MSISEKLKQIAENEEKVFEAGKDALNRKRWEAFSGHYYQYAFAGYSWTDETFRPIHDICPTTYGNANSMFYTTGIKDLKGVLEKCGVKLDLSAIPGSYGLFRNSLITHVPELDLSNCSKIEYMFYASPELETIEKIITSEKLESIKMMFSGNSKLTELRWEGVIACNGLILSGSPNLSHESLVSVINCLADKVEDTSGTEWVLTIGSTNLAKISENELAVAMDKGWKVR